MIVSVVYNEKKDTDGKIITSIKKAFEGKANLKIFTNIITSDDLIGSDLVIALGGDGTIIRASKAAAVYGVPVCGVNLGRIGFLAAVEPEEIEIATEKLLSGDYLIEERMMLETEFCVNGEKKKALALNDIVLSRGNCHKMIDISIDMAGGLLLKIP